MAPMYGNANYDFFDSQEDERTDWDDYEKYEDSGPTKLTEMTFWYMIILVGMLLLWLFIFFCLRIIALRQKTRSPQQRRVYVGSRARPSLAHQEPTIYVSPSNLPPPPKYECMAPPSYEEVVGVHYPNTFPSNVQPITTPLSTALAQSSNQNTNTTQTLTNTEPVTVTVTHEERSTAVTVRT